jgi:hypothetical protein
MIIKNEFKQVSDQSHPTLTTSNEHSAPSLNENGYNNLHWNGVKFTWHGCMRDLILSIWEKTFAYHHSPIYGKTIISDQNGDYSGKQTANQQMNPSLKTFDQKIPYCMNFFCIPQTIFLPNPISTNPVDDQKVGSRVLLDASKVLSFQKRFAIFSFHTIFSPVIFPLGVR